MSLSQADRSISDVIAFFADLGIEVGLLVPTATGLSKSIMDAHQSLRDFLAAHKVHDYKTQAKGPDGKKLLPAWLVQVDGLQASQASLYRPVTKSGDPRIWFSGLHAYAQPGNVLAIIAADGGLFIVNASRPEILASSTITGSPLASLLVRLQPRLSQVAQELLDKLRAIAALGFVRSLRTGPTGIGYTLETMLGIRANSNRAPDYKGIEIKSARVTESGRSATRCNLFSQAPNWKKSPYSALRLLQTYGRLSNKGRCQIYCTLTSTPNSTFGFFLRTDENVDVLDALRLDPAKTKSSTAEWIFRWDVPSLRRALAKKHPETFWVKARTRRSAGYEEFHYFEVEHTRQPLVSHFAPLIDSGHIELDFLLHVQDTGTSLRARDHGYLFKMWDSNRHLLFGRPLIHSLVS